jgi:hypothetical protein
MGAETIALIGTAVATAGSVGQAVYTQQASQASQRAERLRERQMRLDAMKRRRESIRQAQFASSVATARGEAQGVAAGSSVIGGAAAQTTGELGRQINYTNQSEDIGTGIFQANADIAGAQGMSSLFGAAGQFGTTVLGNAQKIYDIGQTLFAPPTTQQSWNMGTSVTPAYNPSVAPAPVNVPFGAPYYGQGAVPY